ncbi:MAG: stage III sporulation protein AB, partial [Lachnospiraceae bacterium]|nr:stage III sporulation protein AB [Lachnospiraceae bacterium]
MIIRIIGSIAVLAACGGFGFYCGGEIERRIMLLKQLRSSMLVLRGDVRYLRSSLPEAFEAAAAREKGELSAFFSGLAEQLNGRMAQSLEEAFRSASRDALSNTALRRQDISMLVRLGGMLGQMDADMQQNAFDWYLEQSKELTEALSAEAAKRRVLDIN